MLMAELSWISRLCLFRDTGAYRTCFLKKDSFFMGTAKYFCVSLLRDVTVRTCRTTRLLIRQAMTTRATAPQTMRRKLPRNSCSIS